MELSTASIDSGPGSSTRAPVRASMSLAAAAGGVAFLILAVIQATNPAFDEVLNTPLDWINEIVFALALLVFIGVVAGWPAGRATEPIGTGVAEFGGSVVPGAMWLYLGVRLGRSRRDERAESRAFQHSTALSSRTRSPR